MGLVIREIEIGMIANYMSLSDKLADEIVEINNEEIIEKIEEIQEIQEELCGILDVDKLWDGLHFLLTAANASEPIEGNPLSEFVVGKHVLDTEDYVSVTGSDELQVIVDAIENI